MADVTMVDAAANVTVQELDITDNDALCVVSAGLADYDGARMPADFCCVVDVSGSMGIEAEVPTAGGAREQTGLSVLDVVRHAVRTIVHILGPEDRLALVAYDTTAEIVFDLTRMGEGADRTQAEERLDALRPKEQTNLWAGLELGLDVLRRARASDGGSQRISAVLLLTDGVPNEVPPEGHLTVLQAYKDRNYGWLPTICTFGFGYDLDSELLQAIAVAGFGSYAFIPDASFVGTVLVNAAANILATGACKVELMLEGVGGAEFGMPLGQLTCERTAAGMKVQLGSLQFGQAREVAVRTSKPGSVKATLRFQAINSTSATEVEGVPGESAAVAEQARWRLTAVDCIADAMDRVKGGSQEEGFKVVTDLAAQVRTVSDASGDEFLKALLEDLNGQVAEALSRKDWFDKWGRHYLPSLARAHVLSQCNNFKDPGVQNYGGKLFSQIRDDADDVFIALPPPKKPNADGGLDPEFLAALPPEIRAEVEREHRMAQAGGGGRPAPAAAAPVDMSRYYDSAGPCFHGDARALLEDGSTKALRSLLRGDRLQTPSGLVTVLCLIETPTADSERWLCKLPGSGLLVTPWHPVRHNGCWCFPCDLAEPRLHPCSAVYNLVLEARHVVVLDGVECVTLGHGFDGPVVGHPFYGTSLVIEVLQKMRGWVDGYVRLSSHHCVERHVADGLACGLREALPHEDRPVALVQ